MRLLLALCLCLASTLAQAGGSADMEDQFLLVFKEPMYVRAGNVLARILAACDSEPCKERVGQWITDRQSAMRQCTALSRKNSPLFHSCVQQVQDNDAIVVRELEPLLPP